MFPTVKEANRDHVSDRPGRMVVAACRERDIPVLDLLPSFRRAVKSSDEELYFALDHHWTPAGHRVAADLMIDFIRDHLPPE